MSDIDTGIEFRSNCPVIRNLTTDWLILKSNFNVSKLLGMMMSWYFNVLVSAINVFLSDWANKMIK